MAVEDGCAADAASLPPAATLPSGWLRSSAFGSLVQGCAISIGTKIHNEGLVGLLPKQLLRVFDRDRPVAGKMFSIDSLVSIRMPARMGKSCRD